METASPPRLKWRAAHWRRKCCCKRFSRSTAFPRRCRSLRRRRPHGLYPDQSQQMEDIARKMFKLPHIEAASHTFSHPFLWDSSVKHGLFLRRELPSPAVPRHSWLQDGLQARNGRVCDYIRQNLCLQASRWKCSSGRATRPRTKRPLKASYEAGLVNINGGDTSISRHNPR